VRPAYAEPRAREASVLLPGRNDEVVFRALRADENPANGLRAAGIRRKGMQTISDVLEKGTRMPSHGISTTHRVMTAYCYAEMWHGEDGKGKGQQAAVSSGHKLVAIRARLVHGDRYDVSGAPTLRRAKVQEGSTAWKYGIKSKETMFTATSGAFVPPEAILGVCDLSGLAHGKGGEGATFESFRRTVPPETERHVQRWADEMRRKARLEAGKDGKVLPDEPLRADKAEWTRAEVLEQLLFHNPHAREVNHFGGRSDATSEEMMVRWAAEGVARVADVVGGQRRRLYTPLQFASRYPKLAHEQWAYEELVQCMPEGWRRALERKDPVGKEAPEAWKWRGDGLVERRVGGKAEFFAQEPNGVRLRRATAEEAQTARRSATREPCTVRPTRPAEGVPEGTVPSPTAGMAGLRALADHEEPYELWDIGAGCGAAADPAQLGVQTRSTLRPACVVRVSDLKAGKIRRVQLSEEWVLPRAFDCTNEGDHFGKLYAHLSPVDFRAKLMQIAKDLQHEAVPPKMQDNLRRVATSSLPTAGKQSQRWHGGTTGLGYCARRCCGGSRFEETLEHLIADCPYAAGLWSAVLLRWNACTGEQLEYTDPRVTMLGDRGDGRRAATEEPWRVLHAVVVGVLLRTARAARELSNAVQPSPSQLLSEVRREMEHAMTNRRLRLQRERKGGLFEERWREVCDARAYQLRCEALDDPTEPCRGKAPPRRRIYTDGSMKQGAQHVRGRIVRAPAHEEAGWSAVTVDLADGAVCGDFDPSLETVTDAEAGVVETDASAPEYRGATTRSNNTAELTALLRAVEKELERPPLPVEICVDSRYALGLADGRWLAPRKRNTDLAKRLRASVRALIRQRGHRNVTLSHVRAHARTPGNEAADQLAKSAARDDGEAKDPMRALALASNTHRTVRDDQTSEQRGHGAAPGRGFGDG
jgi:ribonuclease HI